MQRRTFYLTFAPHAGDAKRVTSQRHRNEIIGRMSETQDAAEMADTKRRFLERTSGSPTVVGPGTVFIGDIHGRGTFVVYGEIRGDGDIHGSLNLAASATWLGDIHAQQAVVAGHVTGSLIVEGKLEIGYTAVIHGKVSAHIIAIARGAIVDGDIETTSGAPLQEFEEKRTAAK
jgi:cytoskeletal protein CcmA (bactofilin family)